MLTITIELWNANDDLARSQVHQIVIANQGTRQKSIDGSFAYKAWLFGPDVHVLTQGTSRGKIPTEKAMGEVHVRHRQANGDLELIFIVMREFRQEYPHLFTAPEETDEEQMSPEMLRAWRGTRIRGVMN